MIWTLVAVGALLALAYVMWERHERREARRLIEEFQRAFPGRCPVCSMHRYGLREGHERPGSRPAPHWCPEMRGEEE